MAPCGDVFADTGSNSSDVKTTTTFKVPNNFTSSYSVNSINESKAYAPSGGGVSFGGIGFGGAPSFGGTIGAAAGGAATGVAVHYMRGKKKRSKKAKSKYRHPHKSSEHTKNARPSTEHKHTKPRPGKSDKKKRQNGRYR